MGYVVHPASQDPVKRPKHEMLTGLPATGKLPPQPCSPFPHPPPPRALTQGLPKPPSTSRGSSRAGSVPSSRYCTHQAPVQRSLRASRSDSSRVSTSPSRTGPFTLRMMERLVSSMNSTRTYGTHGGGQQI
ncbi:hypothetical protein MDA_GLEAN10003674 [Myotis davidii]|uniref:Uncharacterized protein n=1 Tax=Myotis davidii TaxID=225400 RepID=L5LYH6_MYODS|nr:hypothetical protein MDA_GLEAN10003674 [Myotis davidii]